MTRVVVRGPMHSTLKASRPRIARAFRRAVRTAIGELPKPVTPPPLDALRNAFMDGRESCFGTDRHRADAAWDNSRTKRRALETAK